MKRLLLLSLTANAAFMVFIAVMALRRHEPAKLTSYLSNPQYQEQTSIFSAYTSKCEIAFIGDSHIYKCHWSELLGTVVCNRGIGSEVCEGMYTRIGQVIKMQPKKCFILCGANDIEVMSIDTAAYYYKKVVDTLLKSGIEPVIMEGMEVASWYPNSVDINKRMALLNKTLRGYGVFTIAIKLSEKDYQPDGIHLTATGYLKWKEVINSYLKACAEKE